MNRKEPFRLDDDEREVEDQISALLRRSDGSVVIRPLKAERFWNSTIQVSSTVFVLLAVLLGVGAIAGLNARRQEVAATPEPSGFGSALASPSTSPTVGPSGDFTTAEGAAASIQRALEQRDVQLLFRTMAPSGWYARWFAQTQTDPMTGVEAASWILNSPAPKWNVDPNHLRDAQPSMPPGDKYITAVVSDLNGWSEQRADIMLQAIGGRWYWSSLLLYRPPPITAVSGEVAGYASLLDVTEATVTVRFRSIGSRCCSDDAWNGRTVTLRRDGTTTYESPGGVPTRTLADSTAAKGDDVWVRFPIESLDNDASYRLAELVKMYP